jgi:plastocyanin
MDWSPRPHPRAAALVGLAVAVITGLYALRDASTTAAAPPIAAVAVEGFAFKPRTLEVKVGTRVVWTNHDDVTHTVTSGVPEQPARVFSQRLAGKGTRFEFTFTKAGTYAYYCERHESMRGRIVVRE